MKTQITDNEIIITPGYMPGQGGNMKYLKDGTMVGLVKEIEGGYLVNRYLAPYYNHEIDEWEGDEIDTLTIFVEEIFDNAPIAKRCQEMKEWDKKIEDAQRELQKMKAEIKEWGNEIKQRIEKLKKYDQLKYIEEFINGEMKYYVMGGRYGGDYKILPTEEAKSEYDKMQLKLLVLYGNNKRGMEWKLHQYSDSSGFSGKCYPVISYELAVEKLKELIENDLEGDPDNWKIADAVEAAQKYGIGLDSEIIKKAEAIKKQRSAKLIKEKEAAIENLQKELREIKNT